MLLANPRLHFATRLRAQLSAGVPLANALASVGAADGGLAAAASAASKQILENGSHTETILQQHARTFSRGLVESLIAGLDKGDSSGYLGAYCDVLEYGQRVRHEWRTRVRALFVSLALIGLCIGAACITARRSMGDPRASWALLWPVLVPASLAVCAGIVGRSIVAMELRSSLSGVLRGYGGRAWGVVLYGSSRFQRCGATPADSIRLATFCLDGIGLPRRALRRVGDALRRGQPASQAILEVAPVDALTRGTVEYALERHLEHVAFENLTIFHEGAARRAYRDLVRVLVPVMMLGWFAWFSFPMPVPAVALVGLAASFFVVVAWLL